jgi:2,3-bisphosphoglycerate-dependent phosphoglycerate mutase
MADTKPVEYHQKRFERPPGATEILLVRHGASAPLVEGQPFPMLDGQGNPGLAPAGQEQAVKVGQRLSRERIDAVYVSTMQRTHETAAPLLNALGMTPTVDADLREVHLGDWEAGVLRRKAAQGDPIYLRMHEEQRWDVIPNAEQSEAFEGRTVGAIRRIVERHPDQLVVVVCHGGVIGAICAHATGSKAFAFGGADNGSISQIVVAGDRWLLRRFNDSSHLYDTLSTAPDQMT